MFNVVAAFTDRPAANRAIEVLHQRGFEPANVRLHGDLPAGRHALAAEADEYATGGFVQNAYRLLENLLGTPPAEDESKTYLDLMRSGGALVSVEAADSDQALEAQAAFSQAGGARSTWVRPSSANA